MTGLERVVAALGDRVSLRRQDGVQAKCPAHEDLQASLAVKQGQKGVLLMCHAGCKTGDVAKALGLQVSQLFDEPLKKPERKVVATYPYTDEQNRLLFEVVRFEPKGFAQRRPNGNGWDWGLGDVRRVLYHLPALLRSAPKAVFVVEGEKDVHALESLNLVATSASGGAGKWRPEYAEALKGRIVVVIPDNDEPGRMHAKQVADSLAGIATPRILELPGLPAKGDVSDWVAAGGTRAALLALLKPNPVKERIAAIRRELDELERSL